MKNMIQQTAGMTGGLAAPERRRAHGLKHVTDPATGNRTGDQKAFISRRKGQPGRDTGTTAGNEGQ